MMYVSIRCRAVELRSDRIFQIIRHATRYGIPAVTKPVEDLLTGTDKYCNDFLLSKGEGLNAERGLRRARAMTTLMLSLPGCMYFYQ